MGLILGHLVLSHLNLDHLRLVVFLLVVVASVAVSPAEELAVLPVEVLVASPAAEALAVSPVAEALAVSPVAEALVVSPVVLEVVRVVPAAVWAAVSDPQAPAQKAVPAYDAGRPPRLSFPCLYR